jgi:hypothetical protein
MLFVLVKPTWMLILKPRAGVSLNHLYMESHFEPILSRSELEAHQALSLSLGDERRMYIIDAN